MTTKAKKAIKKSSVTVLKEKLKSTTDSLNLAEIIIFYLLESNHDGKHQDDFKTVYNKWLPREFDAHLDLLHLKDGAADGFHFEIDRDVLKQKFIVAAGRVSLIKELPQPELSPVIIK